MWRLCACIAATCIAGLLASINIVAPEVAATLAALSWCLILVLAVGWPRYARRIFRPRVIHESPFLGLRDHNADRFS